MVDLAQSLHGWTESVYRFGCAFIHLSSFHDYLARDPFRALPPDEQETILRHMRYYHGEPPGESPSFSELVPFFPRVFEKVSTNLAAYVDDLECGRNLDDEGDDD
jgi:hypothetical protein